MRERDDIGVSYFGLREPWRASRCDTKSYHIGHMSEFRIVSESHILSLERFVDLGYFSREKSELDKKLESITYTESEAIRLIEKSLKYIFYDFHSHHHRSILCASIWLITC